MRERLQHHIKRPELKDKKDNRRLKIILNCLENHPWLTNYQISQLLCGETTLKELEEERGRESEKRAFQFLSDLPFVSKVKPAPHPNDPLKDFTIYFNRKKFKDVLGRYPSIVSCDVEVKSSLSHIILEREKIGTSEKKILDELALMKLVYLNPRFKFCREEFVAEILRIDDFWRNKFEGN